VSLSGLLPLRRVKPSRENRDGADGEDRRLQFSVKYNLGATIPN